MSKKNKKAIKEDQTELTLRNMTAKRTKKKDGYYNSNNGFGGATDPAQLLSFIAGKVSSYSELENRYRYDWISKKIINTIPEDACREGFNIITGEKDLDVKMMSTIDTLKILSKIKEAMIYARLYGGSVIVIGAFDGKDPKEPLNINNIQKITCLTVLDRWDLNISERYANPFEPKFGEPKLYEIRTAIDGKNTNKTIHESRVVQFNGEFLPSRTRQSNQYWHDSVLVSVDEYLKGFGTSLQMMGNIFQDFITKKLNINNLKDLLASGNETAIDARIQYAMASLVNHGIVTCDADEDFTKIQSPVAGVAELLNINIELAASAANIPRARLFGQSLGTLAGATETTRTYYDNLAAYQKNEVKDPLERLIKIIFLSKNGPTGGKEPENWKLEFNSLWQLTEKEWADIRRTQADTDAVYIDRQVLSPEEVTLSRFPENGYSLKTKIDLESRSEYTGNETEESKNDEPAA